MVFGEKNGWEVILEDSSAVLIVATMDTKGEEVFSLLSWEKVLKTKVIPGERR